MHDRVAIGPRINTKAPCVTMQVAHGRAGNHCQDQESLHQPNIGIVNLRKSVFPLVLLPLLWLLSACGEQARLLPAQVQSGAKPELMQLNRTIIPAVKITPAVAWTIAGADSARLHVGVGSNSSLAQTVMDAEPMPAEVLKIQAATGTTWVFASELCNPCGVDSEPRSGTLWIVINEHDEIDIGSDGIGSDFVPGYLTSTGRDAFYGRSYNQYGQKGDKRVW